MDRFNKCVFHAGFSIRIISFFFLMNSHFVYTLQSFFLFLIINKNINEMVFAA